MRRSAYPYSRRRTMAKRKREKSPRQKLVAKLDATFSRLVRLSFSDRHTGMVACYTCGVVKHWKEMHCGHFCSRRNRSIRWDHKNCRVQCPGCNTFGRLHGPGEPVIFRQKLQAEGVDVRFSCRPSPLVADGSSPSVRASCSASISASICVAIASISGTIK